MAKSDLIELDGEVIAHNGNIYTVRVETPGQTEKDVVSHEVNCHLTGKLRMNYIRILVGDKVQIRVSPYDLTQGTITYRYRS